MQALTIGILKETKTPPDFRVPFLPEQLNNIIAHYPHVQILVESSPTRAVKDDEYRAAGITVVDSLDDADILFGIKETKVSSLLPNKTYCIFSHTIKQQPYNRALLQTMARLGNTLLDYELFTDDRGVRTTAFGQYAGIVGAYNGIMAYGLKTGRYTLQRAIELGHMALVRKEYAKVDLGPIKIVVTGTGRVGAGIKEVLDGIGIREVSPEYFLHQAFDEPVYTTLGSQHMYELKDGRPWSREFFHQNPAEAQSIFKPYTETAEILIAGAYWNPLSPRLFELADIADPSFKLQVIADVTCDIDGSIPSTIRASDIPEPLYDLDRQTGAEVPLWSDPSALTIMAVDNLPCELPRDASSEFGGQLYNSVIPALAGTMSADTIKRATILDRGYLTERFSYLADYLGDAKPEVQSPA